MQRAVSATGYSYVRAEMAVYAELFAEYLPPSEYGASVVETVAVLAPLSDEELRLTVIRERAWYDGIDWEDARGEATRDTYRHLFEVMERKGLL
jgi:hypothetical protein